MTFQGTKYQYCIQMDYKFINLNASRNELQVYNYILQDMGLQLDIAHASLQQKGNELAQFKLLDIRQGKNDDPNQQKHIV